MFPYGIGPEISRPMLMDFERIPLRFPYGSWPRALQTQILLISKDIPEGFHMGTESSARQFPMDFERKFSRISHGNYKQISD